MELLYTGHQWDRLKCPEYRGVLISRVIKYISVSFWTEKSVLSIQGFPYRGVSLYKLTSSEKLAFCTEQAHDIEVLVI